MLVGLALALGLASCGNESPPAAAARTYDESLDLSTPVAGAQTFVEAFAGDDFMTVFLALDDEAQFAVKQYWSLLEYDRLINTAAVPDLQAELRRVQALGQQETFEMGHLFDRLMLLADRHDAFLIDLSGRVTMGEAAVTSAEADSSDVSAEVEGVDGTVVFRMAASPAGRWRVRQVIVPGGNEETIPWSVGGVIP